MNNKKFIVTARTYSTVIIGDQEYDGSEVVIGYYYAPNYSAAIEQASKEEGIDEDLLDADEIVQE